MKQYNKYYEGNEPLTSTDTISVKINYYRRLKIVLAQTNPLNEAPVLI